MRSDQKQPFVPGELWRARQLKEYRRLHGLCFKCGDKFSPTHKCSSSQLNALDTDNGDGGGILSDDILDVLECNFMQLSHNTDAFLSLNAISGTQKHRAIQLRALVQNQVILILVDSGSSHTFLNSAILDRIPCTPTDITPMKVRVANGAVVPCSQEVKNFEWWIQGHTFKTDAKLMHIGAYDLILGMDWLEQFRPMNCDWLFKWMEFHYKGQLIRLQGVLSQPVSRNAGDF
uniref:Uncharacterized protein n=1 Tax=Arundo donax TaxID=35708 RepID=A0A0A8XTC1_ARUDO